ncbi:hypothetical protein CHLNCDRAFT_141567 [Chlorella variabilis]|uniref:Uncharacterized protein n=1 Tax=Chlorella variabilis TaxID=554065 RepID=E1ZT52_CHLVA|nr:hypothetical protein CHLNCDRAFT_141567 [Chlorella variabilis]EFN51017.1 hypothetical protein CHLNCDRAFT_141567 [Chlorella variabilis]|eukprot:XP_005843119.1 hypothetical protein CHLNCDRAFT_141567 [Chlorella variabilis]
MGKAFLVAGGAVGLDVYRASRSEQGLIAEVAEELQEAAAAERSAKLEEQAISGFEDAIKQRQQETADAQAALEEARVKLTKLVQDARRHQQAATAAEQALAAAHQQTLAAKQGISPLQHPLWYDSLLGANHLNFVVGAQAPDGAPVSFLLKAHAYEYVKHEYYLQGGEVKKMFRAMALRPGDGLKLVVSSRASGIPTTRLTVIPADRNPNAATILSQAAQQAAKREARLAAKPTLAKGGGGGSRKRKTKGEGAQEEYEWDDDSEGEGGVRPSRLRVVKRYGDEFVVGLDEAWQHAATSDDEYAPMSDYEAHSGDSSFRRRRRGGGTAVDAPAVPAANGRKGRASNGRISDEGCPLQLLAGLANDVVTPQAQQQQQQGPAAGSNGGGTAQGATPEPVALVAKRLLRDAAGTVHSAMLKIGWQPGSRSMVHISRKLSQYSAAQAENAGKLLSVDTFEVLPAECRLELTLRLQHATGRVDVLENCIMELLDIL